MELIKLRSCDVCGTKEVLGMVACSAFGAQSFAYCEECLAKGREPYSVIVDYISSAGRWPSGINAVYQKEIRRQLRLHNKTEAEFAADVKNAIAFE